MWVDAALLLFAYNVEFIQLLYRFNNCLLLSMPLLNIRAGHQSFKLNRALLSRKAPLFNPSNFHEKYLRRRGSRPPTWCRPRPRWAPALVFPTGLWIRPCCLGPLCFGAWQPTWGPHLSPMSQNRFVWTITKKQTFFFPQGKRTNWLKTTLKAQLCALIVLFINWGSVYKCIFRYLGKAINNIMESARL